MANGQMIWDRLPMEVSKRDYADLSHWNLDAPILNSLKRFLDAGRVGRHRTYRTRPKRTSRVLPFDR